MFEDEHGNLQGDKNMHRLGFYPRFWTHQKPSGFSPFSKGLPIWRESFKNLRISTESCVP
jgi:hypothetical protein